MLVENYIRCDAHDLAGLIKSRKVSREELPDGVRFVILLTLAEQLQLSLADSPYRFLPPDIRTGFH